ncbi:MAG: hypothetical protein K6U14_05745 [Firmicutes bacterium]|nr:hypothetical protein [Alicyclobacillaceae bacterium]MCL6497122.1 hypothetical protein [Bacillota bacterium]
MAAYPTPPPDDLARAVEAYLRFMAEGLDEAALGPEWEPFFAVRIDAFGTAEDGP